MSRVVHLFGDGGHAWTACGRPIARRYKSSLKAVPLSEHAEVTCGNCRCSTAYTSVGQSVQETPT
jgi:hypothetical protein